MRELLTAAARGLEPAEYVLKNGQVLNVFTGRVCVEDVAVSKGLIVGHGQYRGIEEIDCSGLFLTPGLIDPHLHLESSMLAPPELARILLAHGTTTMITDPHEIANVLGLDGIRWLIETSRDLPLDIFFMAPSCVPATHLETAGARLDAADLATLADEPRVLGLAEVMNVPGVILGDPGVWDKIHLFEHRHIDGHAPLLSGPDLGAYAMARIENDHESSRLGEAREKLANGIRVFIREGSQARNLKDLLPAVDEFTWPRISFCTDDRHVEDLLEQGHLDHVLRKAVSLGLAPEKAVTLATLNPAQAHELKWRGALAPGWMADVAVWRDLTDFKPVMVLKNGRPVFPFTDDGPGPAVTVPDWASPMNVGPLSKDRLALPAASRRARAIGVLSGQVVTEALVVDTPSQNGLLAADPERDLARLFVFERHQGSGRVGMGLVRGLGMKTGALASSVAHDSHNIVAAGMADDDVLAAVQAVADMKGGQAVAAGGRVLARLPLPIAGLLSPAPAARVAEGNRALTDAVRGLGCRLKAPLMALSFLALPVIPELKLTDLGLVDVGRFEVTPFFL